MKIIGRKKEINELKMIYESEQPEFIAIYGRRRVGKTFLINELYGSEFAFSVTGLANSTMKGQLENFNLSLNNYSEAENKFGKVDSWLLAFDQLRILLEEKSKRKTGRQVVFIDELPWIDTHKSGFISALEHFWNTWASSKEDVFFVVCGSATSWMINKLINNKGGLHNRVTRQMKLEPYTLEECEEFYENKGIKMNRYQMVESYMILGGIPYYLSLMNKQRSLEQNINRLCFESDGQLKDEFNRLYSSLFVNPENHIEIVRTLNKKMSGLTRDEIICDSGLPDGGNTTKALRELELSGFIRKYHSFDKKKKDAIYQLIDFFSLFYLRFMTGKSGDDTSYWIKYSNSPGHNSWSGYAYELVCLVHVEQIKKALGISGIGTNVSSWRGSGASGGAQIDLVIDRADNVINLCEIKFSESEYTIDKKYDAVLRNKRKIFKETTKTKKALHQTMITTYGLTYNEYSGNVQSQLTFDDLFE